MIWTAEETYPRRLWMLKSCVCKVYIRCSPNYLRACIASCVLAHFIDIVRRWSKELNLIFRLWSRISTWNTNCFFWNWLQNALGIVFSLSKGVMSPRIGLLVSWVAWIILVVRVLTISFGLIKIKVGWIPFSNYWPSGDNKKWHPSMKV